MPVYSRQPGVPTGTIKNWSSLNLPAGYLWCDGTLHNIADQPALYAVIGTTYGGDGVTTFAVPQLCGEHVRGLDMGRGVDPGRTIGSYVPGSVATHGHTLAIDAVGDHQHQLPPNHDDFGSSANLIASGYPQNGQVAKFTNAAGAHTHTGTAQDNVGGTPENLVRTVALPYVIKA